ncbi:hypothetical protein EYF80_004518 [Liparis tanakae]|uniref:Uncharacterized protein n=1 Tax=Liparis tanakae TaxID=230148 RepID=A0A4Z2J686_9TELE|nr:hypothetical protein EYF80_004518 [Liparis tanakae]
MSRSAERAPGLVVTAEMSAAVPPLSTRGIVKSSARRPSSPEGKRALTDSRPTGGARVAGAMSDKRTEAVPEKAVMKDEPFVPTIEY